jgi:hypothetical protein
VATYLKKTVLVKPSYMPPVPSTQIHVLTKVISLMTTICMQNIPLSASIDNLIGHLTSDRKRVASYLLECSHDDPLKKVAMITFMNTSSFKEALCKHNTKLYTASDSVRIGIDDLFRGFTVVARGSGTDIEYRCSARLLSLANDPQYCRISQTGWTCF